MTNTVRKDEKCPVCGVPRGKLWGVEPCRVASGTSAEVIAAEKRLRERGCFLLNGKGPAAAVASWID